MEKSDHAVESAEEEDDHFEELPDGAGCTGIWEYLSERRERNDD